MATATAARGTTNGTTADHIKRFEKKVLNLKQAVRNLPGDDFYTTLLGHLHNPGWTTIAEGLFFESIVDGMVAQTEQLGQMHRQLMAGSAAVGLE